MAEIVSFIPPHAVITWTDGKRIFVVLPKSPGFESDLPVILDFALTEGGLNKALNILRERKTDFAGSPQITPRRKFVGTDTQHATAMQALKARGIL